MRFAYSGRNRDGRAVDGELEAEDSAALAAMLLASGTVPIRIAPADVAAGSGRGNGAAGLLELKLFEKKLPTEDMLNFCRQMHTLLRSGVPITRALAALHESATHEGFGLALLDLRRKLESGRELSSAMEAHARFFHAYFRSMVRIGEATGRIDEIFIRLYEHLEFEKDMDQRVKSATRYPTFVVAAISIALVVINIFVIPAFANVYKSMHATLPLVTRILVGFSDFTVHQWPLLLFGVAAAAGAFRSWKRSTAGRLIWDRWMLRAPVIGSLLHKAALARFARSLALALQSGLQVTDALAAAMQTSDNRYVLQQLDGMRSSIDRGDTVTQAARATGIFTPVVLQMLAVGEESGTIDELLAEVALAYESDVAYELKGLSDAIEPILIVALGMIVLVLALGVFLPMWDLGHAALSDAKK